MIFLNTTFLSGEYTLLPPATSQYPILTVMIKDGTYNHLYLSKNGLKDATFNWDYDTLLNADFDNDLTAGNNDFHLLKTDRIVVRRREKGEQKWITLYTKEINVVEDFNIHIVDKYARSNTEYEYQVSSYLNGVENSVVIKNVYSNFEGFYITDKDCLYGTIYNVDNCDTTRNVTAQILELLNSKYIHVVSNSSANYDSGTISGVFMDYDIDKDYLDKQKSWKYREDIKNRLSNKKPLILKVQDGRIWMIKVSGEISDNNDGHIDLRRIGFGWVEIGDLKDMQDLYGYGFVDIDSRWW